MSKVKTYMKLPKVGDKLVRCMNTDACDESFVYVPLPCKVTYVNEKHGWYKVKFDAFDIEECYGLPVFDHSVIDKNVIKIAGIPVICMETGDIYSTIRECSRDMHIDYGDLYLHLVGTKDHVKGYHFAKLI